ncbi:MAG: energy transducer TonB [Acidobacteria bacterium]|nr:energy transducer TonB [Acidobacteriota bacterium]
MIRHPISHIVLLFLFFLPAAGQRIAVLTPEKNDASGRFAEKLAASLAAKFRVLDAALGEAAFAAVAPETPFNLTTEEARSLGAAIGGDGFLLVRAAIQPRNSFEKKEYFEAYAVVCAVSTRTGRLVFWKLASFNADRRDAAEKLLLEAVPALAGELAEKLPAVFKRETVENKPVLDEIPDPDSPAAKNFRTPLPYRRISPPYTATANLYRVAATVDIEVDFDETGRVTRTEIVRWAGFGLDEAVEETVRRMNWRPAVRDGRPLPVRVLLRYNFKKLE